MYTELRRFRALLPVPNHVSAAGISQYAVEIADMRRDVTRRGYSRWKLPQVACLRMHINAKAHFHVYLMSLSSEESM